MGPFPRMRGKARCLVGSIRKKELRNLSAFFASSDDEPGTVCAKVRAQCTTVIAVPSYYLAASAITRSLEEILELGAARHVSPRRNGRSLFQVELTPSHF